MTAHAEDMVLVPRAELDALRAENRRLRREAGDREALRRIRSDSGEGRTFTGEELAEAWGMAAGHSRSALDGFRATPLHHSPAGKGGAVLPLPDNQPWFWVSLT
jgi:hypothetical protein